MVFMARSTPIAHRGGFLQKSRPLNGEWALAEGSGPNHPVGELVWIRLTGLQREMLDQQRRNFLQGLRETAVEVADLQV
ncbi:MAG: hypothetical protein RLZZ177_2036, partial [Pseudomonadota bacterium]